MLGRQEEDPEPSRVVLAYLNPEWLAALKVMPCSGSFPRVHFKEKISSSKQIGEWIINTQVVCIWPESSAYGELEQRFRCPSSLPFHLSGSLIILFPCRNSVFFHGTTFKIANELESLYHRLFIWKLVRILMSPTHYRQSRDGNPRQVVLKPCISGAAVQVVYLLKQSA